MLVLKCEDVPDVMDISNLITSSSVSVVSLSLRALFVFWASPRCCSYLHTLHSLQYRVLSFTICIRGACISSFTACTRDAHTYYGACILLFTVHAHDACTYHGCHILPFSIHAHTTPIHTITRSIKSIVVYCQWKMLYTVYSQKFSVELIFETWNIPWPYQKLKFRKIYNGTLCTC